MASNTLPLDEVEFPLLVDRRAYERMTAEEPEPETERMDWLEYKRQVRAGEHTSRSESGFWFVMKGGELDGRLVKQMGEE